MYEHTRDIQMLHGSVSSSQSDILVTRMVATTCNDFHGDLASYVYAQFSGLLVDQRFCYLKIEMFKRCSLTTIYTWCS